MRRRQAARLAVLWALVVLVLTLAPEGGVPRWPWAAKVHLDKFVHAFLFGVQAVLAYWAIPAGNAPARVQTRAGLVILATTLYGGLIEVLQEALGQGRHGDLLDLAADCAGAVAGVAFLVWRGRT